MSKEIVPIERIAHAIFVLRGQKVMLSQDLAELYGVTVGALTQAVKRNADRFPKDFVYQLKAGELAGPAAVPTPSPSKGWRCFRAS